MKIEHLFYYPVATSKIEKEASFFNDLKDLIYGKMEKSKGVKISNAGGWQSDKDLFEGDEQIVVEFRDEIKSLFLDFLSDVYKHSFNKEDLQMEAWANVNFKGNSNNSHDHTVNDNHWSGILYVDSGSEKAASSSGKTIFENRNLSGDGRFISNIPILESGADNTMAEVAYQPEKGKVVFFPGSLWHRVATYDGEKNRITIAYNFRVKGLRNFQFDMEDGKPTLMSKLWINYRGFMVMGSRIKTFLFR